MSSKLLIAILIACVGLVFNGCSGDRELPNQPPVAANLETTLTTGAGATVGIPEMDNRRQTPFQQSIRQTVAERAVRGLPVPDDVSFDYESPSGAPLSSFSLASLAPGETVTIVATTTIHYESPAQAGHASWPAIIVEDEMPAGATGSIIPGDYSDLIRAKVDEAIPGYWQHVEFGQEPRTYHFTETIVLTSPSLGAPAAAPAEPGALDTEAGIVMGFTIPGPGLDYTLNWDFEVCDPLDLDLCVTAVDFRAGFALDWGLGIRLPLEVALASVNPVNEGDTFVPTSLVTGLDWSADDFSNAGVLPEEGNEFVMRFEFFLGVSLEVFGVEVIGLGFTGLDPIEESDSFTTPLGPGDAFSLPSIDIPLRQFGPDEASLTIGFRLTPNVGSDEFTAEWGASSDASGSGSLSFNASGASDDLSSVFAIDGPGSADITVNDFEYVFTQFFLDLDVFAALNVFGVVEEDFVIPITDFDLSNITPDVSMGPHPGSSPTAAFAAVEVLNVAPTAEIDLAGSVMVNGIPTFVARTGEVLTFTGTATDPGLDDLTLRWDWGDGDPSPDMSTLYPVPYDVTESQDHVFDDACLYVVTFSAEDDDGAVGTDQVYVLITEGNDNAARMEGYWQHQLSGHGNLDFDEGTLQCYLDIAQHVSTVFNEVRDASTVPAGHDVLFLKKNRGSELEQFDRELLVVWLNFANGSYTLTEMVDTDNDDLADMPFAAAVAAAEAVRLDEFATERAIRYQTWVLHHISSAKTGLSGEGAFMPHFELATPESREARIRSTNPRRPPPRETPPGGASRVNRAQNCDPDTIPYVLPVLAERFRNEQFV